MRVLSLFPLLLLPALGYVLIWASSGGNVEPLMASNLFSIAMISGEVWRVSVSAAFIGFAVLCLFLEVVRSAVPTKWTLGQNMTTAVALTIGVGLFLVARGFATSEFFLIVLLLLLDFVTDATIMAITSRRTVQYDRQ